MRHEPQVEVFFDRGRYQERLQSATRRIRRDEQKDALYDKLIQIRKTFEDAFGLGTAATYLGLEPKLIEVQTEVLRRHAEETIYILSREDFVTPEPLVKGIWENSADYAEQLNDSFKPFLKNLDEIESQKREIERAQVRKTDLLEEIENRLTWSTRFFEAAYHLAGKSSHADRLRRKVGTRTSPEETESDKAAESASDDESTSDSQVEDDVAADSQVEDDVAADSQIEDDATAESTTPA